MPDGNTVYVEERRTGRKRLSAVTMWKHPAALDVDRISSNLQQNALDDGGHTLHIITRPLFQREESAEPRGWFRVKPDGSYEIGRTKIGDLSTFVHETAHGYLLMMRDLAAREGASETLRGDLQKAREFLGADNVQDFTREQQETWARATEQYLREGKSPSQKLKAVFQRLSIWLGRIYKSASDLGVELNDDIRGVFDRLRSRVECGGTQHEMIKSVVDCSQERRCRTSASAFIRVDHDSSARVATED